MTISNEPLCFLKMGGMYYTSTPGEGTRRFIREWADAYPMTRSEACAALEEFTDKPGKYEVAQLTSRQSAYFKQCPVLIPSYPGSDKTRNDILVDRMVDAIERSIQLLGGSKEIVRDMLTDEFRNDLLVVWNIEDVRSQTELMLSDRECNDVLDMIGGEGDNEVGINYQVVSDYIDKVWEDWGNENV
jgi:hypothetical protein